MAPTPRSPGKSKYLTFLGKINPGRQEFYHIVTAQTVLQPMPIETHTKILNFIRAFWMTNTYVFTF